MEISLLPAFLGETLALLSPCGALLLPGYLASAVTRWAGLLLHAAVFYLGLVLTLVPLGVGAGALGGLLAGHRSALIAVTSAVLVLLGALQALGLGADPARILPGAEALRQASARGRGLARTLLLGAVGGVAGFCAGPILGAVLTLAAGQGGILRGAVLLAAYGAGMVVPLLLLALAWDRLGPRSLRLLRGRPFTLAGRTLHTTTAATGVLIMGLGVLFWATNGLVSLPSPVPTRVLARWQEGLGALNGPGVQIALLVAAGLVALGLCWRADQRRPGADAGREVAGREDAHTEDAHTEDARREDERREGER
ncbi:cytochrome c biogenesis protein CcdA [Brachybacterium saurashtrense]|uniref:Cytochrome c biogenesis protein CcdA n=1 Tax=Brachybacterium saurashtrense TaxID=556288 RepID=A0A345YRF1_9MICO|nr:cytochrome c biogenesis protein CcdA [Brachybacterium saurashtrense]AXK46503.1 cytochrome c biogenesis protein CcdA [Brachybacterium saurashtrense]RRR24244.1 cytochrome c biogenesis protein CcdA [Brachybacterium saurashtrense]